MPGSPWLIANAAKLVVAAVILVMTTVVTWSYNAGRWGIKLYELVLKLMVAGIVVCFFGVIWTLRQQLDWSAIVWGFVPDLRRLVEPSDRCVIVPLPNACVWPVRGAVTPARGGVGSIAAP